MIAKVENLKLPQFSNNKEFNIGKLHLFEDNNEKCNLILGRETC